DPGGLETPVVGHGAAEHDAGVDIGAGGPGALQHDASVAAADAVTGTDLAREALAAGGDSGGVAGDVFDSDHEFVVVVDFDGTFGEGSEADLGPLEVGEDPDGAVLRFSCGP